MTQRAFKLTTVGLSVREDLRVRSLLKASNTKTRDQWLYTEDVNSDIALCNPGSALATVIQRRAAANNRPRCVMVLSDGGGANFGNTLLKSPIRLADLIEVLNDLSNTIASHGSDAMAADPTPFKFALQFRELTAKASRYMYRIDAAEVSLLVLPAMRMILQQQQIDSVVLRTLIDPKIETRVTQKRPVRSKAAHHLVARNRPYVE